MMNKCKIARCLSILICILYITSPIYAFSASTANQSRHSKQKIVFQNLKNEASSVFVAMEENEEEIDSPLISLANTYNDFIFIQTESELTSQEKTIIQNRACKFHLPLWLDVRHILQ